MPTATTATVATTSARVGLLRRKAPAACVPGRSPRSSDVDGRVEERLHVGRHHLGRAARVGQSGRVRQQRHARVAPERVLGIERLLLEDVEHRMPESSGAQGGTQIRLDHVCAARQVDQCGAARHGTEEARVEQAARGRRQRQQVDHDRAAAQTGEQRIVAMDVQHTVWQVARRVAVRPAGDAVAQRRQRTLVCATNDKQPSPLSGVCGCGVWSGRCVVCGVT